MDKNFNYPLEEIARRHPAFAQRWTQISQQTRNQLATAHTEQQRHNIQQQSNQQIWKEIIQTIKK